jgi:TonB family protein
MKNMKPILIAIAFLAVFSVAKAQKTDTTKQAQIFAAVEQEPTPAEGMAKFYAYLQANTKYPDSAAKKRIEGKVFVTFVVERDGSLSDVKILRGVSPDIDAEAIRVVRSAPKWKPGIQNNVAVRVQYSMAISFRLPAQTSKDKKMDSIMNLPADQKIFSAVEQEPSPAGGMSAFYNYITRNTSYPKSAKDQDIQGKVFLTFTVEKDGSLSNIKVLRGLSADIDAEAIRVLQNAPKWNPGMQNGRPVRVQYNVPISFPPQKIN